MVAQLPKLRSDLIFSRQGAEGNVSFVIKDPANGQFFRFRETEHFIARQLDGATGSEEVCRRVEAKFGLELEEGTLANFVKALEQNRLLEAGEGVVRAPKRRRLRGNLLYLRFQVCDPDRLFNRLVGKVRFCFTPHFIILSAAMVLIACCVLAFNWGEFKQDLPRLYRLTAIPMIWAIIMVVTTLHEFAHGLTCKHHGGEVHELGFLLMYFQPALYCNVSDAWMFPQKSRRLWVTFAGPYFELFVWALATLLWRFSDANTWVNYVALAVTATSGFKAWLNFNPLLKLDGYYLLSDLLEMPNLRRRSYAYIGTGIKRFFGVQTPGTETPRERRIFLAYGVVASVFSFWLLGFMALKLGAVVSKSHRGLLGFFLVLLLFFLKIRRRLRRLFPETKAWFTSVKAALAAMKRPIVASAMLAALALLACFGRAELKVTGPLRVLPVRNADVRAEVEGTVEEIRVDEGDLVHQGDLIARLSDRDNAAELRKTEARIAQSTAKLQLLKAGPTKEEIEVARAAVDKAEASLRYTRNRLGRDKALFEQSLLSRQDFEATQQQAVTAENDLAEAKGKLNVLLSGSRPEELDQTRAEIASLEAQRQYLDEQVKLARVISPTSGVVATPSRQLKELVHQLVKKGDLIAKVYELRTIEAETPIAESEIADVRVGQTVALKARAYPDLTFLGRVTSIGTAVQPVPEGKEGARTVLVTTQIDNDALLLKPEMTGNAKILCGSHRIIDLVRRRLARTFKVEFWSWW